VSIVLITRTDTVNSNIIVVSCYLTNHTDILLLIPKNKGECCVRFASHVNVSVIIAGGYYLAYQYISSLHHIIPSSNISATPLNIPWALTWLLLGTSFVDIDTRIGPGHRTRSPLHKAELPLIICGVCLLLPHLCGISIIQKYLPHIQHLVRVATFFSAGWALHLVGDFIQGGIGSYVFKRKIGLT